MSTSRRFVTDGAQSENQIALLLGMANAALAPQTSA